MRWYLCLCNVGFPCQVGRILLFVQRGFLQWGQFLCLEALFVADFLHEVTVLVLIVQWGVGCAVLVPIVILSRETFVLPVGFNDLR